MDDRIRMGPTGISLDTFAGSEFEFERQYLGTFPPVHPTDIAIELDGLKDQYGTQAYWRAIARTTKEVAHRNDWAASLFAAVTKQLMAEGYHKFPEVK